MAIPAVGSAVPRRRYRVLRPLGLQILKHLGWTAEGVIPNSPRLVVAVAPHSSNWDFVVGAAMMVVLELRVSFIAKHTLFRGPLGWFLRWLGGIPVDRSRPEGFAEQMIAIYARREALWLAVTPEGTRSPGARFKSGFYRIAQATGAPILPVYFNHARRVIGFLPLVQPDAATEAGVAQIRDLLLQHGARKQP